MLRGRLQRHVAGALDRRAGTRVDSELMLTLRIDIASMKPTNRISTPAAPSAVGGDEAEVEDGDQPDGADGDDRAAPKRSMAAPRQPHDEEADGAADHVERPEVLARVVRGSSAGRRRCWG